MSKVVKVSDEAYQRISDEASRLGLFLIDALDNFVFGEDLLNDGDEEVRDGTIESEPDVPGFDENGMVRRGSAQTVLMELELDHCPMCGADVGWSNLQTRRSPVAFMLKSGLYRRCPICAKERQVEARRPLRSGWQSGLYLRWYFYPR